MSRKLLLKNLSDERREKISEELQIEIEANKFAFNKQSSYVLPYDVDNTYVYIPFNYDKKSERPKREELSKSNIIFDGKVREYQKEIVTNSINTLNKEGSVLISAYPGFGKCLGYNTTILMYNGDIKYVQDIKKNELIMGDDSTPRTILSTITNYDNMYKIKLSNNDEYIVNSEHILSLYNIDDKKEDIELNIFLTYPKELQKKYKSYKNIINYPEQKIEINPYKLGKIIDEKFDNIPKRYLINTIEIRRELLRGIIQTKKQIINQDEIIIKIGNEKLINDIIYLTKSLGIYTVKIDKYTIKIYSKKENKYEFIIEKYNYDKYYGFEIDGNKRFVLGDFTVTHNTSCSLYIASKIQLKTLILTHRIVLIKQWEEAVKKFCPTTKVQIINKKIDNECDIYIINPVNVQKYGRDAFKHIGTVICDEAHLLMADSMAKAFTYLTPRYNIGLSGTPYRTDGRNMLFTLYYSQIFHKKLHREHIVYTIKTGFIPKTELNSNGKIDWGSLIESQAIDENRNNLIIKLVKYLKDRTILVPVKRVSQGKYLHNKLKEEKESVTSLLGSQQEFDKEARVLIGTIGKTGCGFDHPKLNTLILGTDIVSYYIQVIGRVLRTPEGIPIIIELLDENPILMKHYRDRRKIYLEHGGIIKDFMKTFPDFEI